MSQTLLPTVKTLNYYTSGLRYQKDTTTQSQPTTKYFMIDDNKTNIFKRAAIIIKDHIAHWFGAKTISQKNLSNCLEHATTKFTTAEVYNLTLEDLCEIDTIIQDIKRPANFATYLNSAHGYTDKIKLDKLTQMLTAQLQRKINNLGCHSAGEINACLNLLEQRKPLSKEFLADVDHRLSLHELMQNSQDETSLTEQTKARILLVHAQESLASFIKNHQILTNAVAIKELDHSPIFREWLAKFHRDIPESYKTEPGWLALQQLLKHEGNGAINSKSRPHDHLHLFFERFEIDVLRQKNSLNLNLQQAAHWFGQAELNHNNLQPSLTLLQQKLTMWGGSAAVRDGKLTLNGLTEIANILTKIQQTNHFGNYLNTPDAASTKDCLNQLQALVHTLLIEAKALTAQERLADISGLQQEIDTACEFSRDQIVAYLEINQRFNQLIDATQTDGMAHFLNLQAVIKHLPAAISDEIKAKLIIHHYAYQFNQYQQQVVNKLSSLAHEDKILHTPGADDFAAFGESLHSQLPLNLQTSSVKALIKDYVQALYKFNVDAEGEIDFSRQVQDNEGSHYRMSFLPVTLFLSWMAA